MISKILLVFGGTSIAAVGIVMFLKGDMGVDPVSTFLLGMLNLFPAIQFGTASLIFNIVVLLLLIVLDRKEIGVGSVINAFCLGLIINFISATGVIANIQFHGLFFAILGPILLGLGSGIYLSTGLGAAALEGLMVFISKRTKFSLKIIRIFLDASMVLIGFLLGGQVGIGTIIGVLLIGPTIEYTLKLMGRIPLLQTPQETEK